MRLDGVNDSEFPLGDLKYRMLSAVSHRARDSLEQAEASPVGAAGGNNHGGVLTAAFATASGNCG